MADLIENCRGMIGLLTVLGALLLGARAQQEEFGLVGSDVTLVPKYTGDLKEISWELNGGIFVEIVLKPKEELIYPLTKDRTTINKANGALTIKYLTTGDSGLYRAKALVKIPEYTEIRLTVRDCPDQPIISVQSTKDWFVVSCESFSPDVTYEWFNPTRSVSKSQSYAEPKKNGTLTCVVYNEVCNKRSSINFYTPAQREVKSERDDVTLVPQYTGDPSEIIWKVNGDDLVVMVLKPRGDIIFHRLQDRATISHTDGSLTIRDLKIWDTGVYTAEVLVNNEYYYTERRLTVLESRGLPGGDITGIAIGGLFLIISFIIAFFLLWYLCCRKSRRPSRVNFNAEKKICRKEHSKPYKVEFKAVKDSDIERAVKESERCITLQFCNDVKNGVDESQRLLEHHSKRIQSPRLTIRKAFLAEDGNFTADAVMSDGKPHRFTQDENDSTIIVFEDKGKTAQELVFKKDGVTQFEYAFSSLKLHASIITLEPEYVVVYNAEGEQSYRVNFRLEEPPVSMSICIITFHHSKMTGIDPSTWKKEGQPVNIDGKRIKCDLNGDLTIYDATYEDKGKYTVQCKDKQPDQEFILHL